MRTERLHVEIGYVPIDRTYGARAYEVGTGNSAAKRAINGKATQTPLIRDDTGTVLVGRATITGPDGGKLEGEAYVDDTLLFTGKVNAMHISPTLHTPGVRAAAARGPRTRRWVEGRAGQPGAPTVPRSTFYRHHEPWLLVR